MTDPQRERATFQFLEWLNANRVCTKCENKGGEGSHTQDCEFYSLLQAWRLQQPAKKGTQP